MEYQCGLGNSGSLVTMLVVFAGRIKNGLGWVLAFSVRRILPAFLVARRGGGGECTR